ncbi:MAG: MliC family protein [Spirochaetia bacterium]|jgi:membrane-bound inhibitor of C-type lysozyme|nr:MliC family protein [Spirochaetia bacterium]
MKRNGVRVLAVLLLVFATGSCSTRYGAPLGVNVINEAEYICTDDSLMKVRYYSLTDNSLYFVKIVMSDGNEYTLPQVIAASGARYSDDRNIQFWIKGDSMTLYSLGAKGEWEKITEGIVKE